MFSDAPATGEPMGSKEIAERLHVFASSTLPSALSQYVKSVSAEAEAIGSWVNRWYWLDRATLAERLALGTESHGPGNPAGRPPLLADPPPAGRRLVAGSPGRAVPGRGRRRPNRRRSGDVAAGRHMLISRNLGDARMPDPEQKVPAAQEPAEAKPAGSRDQAAERKRARAREAAARAAREAIHRAECEFPPTGSELDRTPPGFERD